MLLLLLLLLVLLVQLVLLLLHGVVAGVVRVEEAGCCGSCCYWLSRGHARIGLMILIEIGVRIGVVVVGVGC